MKLEHVTDFKRMGVAGVYVFFCVCVCENE